MKVKWIVTLVCLLMFGVATADDHGVSWESLNEGQQQMLSQFADSWNSLPAERQARLARAR